VSLPGAPIVDTHLHLDEPAFDVDRDAVLDEARQAGVVRFINIGHTPERWASSRALRDRHPDVDIVLGVHPQQADDYDSAVDSALRAATRNLGPVAVGETGFDFFQPTPSPEEQENAFTAQLALAAEFGLPVVIHQRQAAEATARVLDQWPDLAPIVLHSFDGPDWFAHWATSRGCLVGIGGLAAKPGAEALRVVLRQVPVERLLLETDAPYLPPPGSVDRRNTPANLPRIASILAPLWNLKGEELCRRTTQTAGVVFGRPQATQIST
jgi:TatD DNase family protein